MSFIEILGNIKKLNKNLEKNLFKTKNYENYINMKKKGKIDNNNTHWSWFNTYIHTYIHTYIYIYIYVCVCVCVCVSLDFNLEFHMVSKLSLVSLYAWWKLWVLPILIWSFLWCFDSLSFTVDLFFICFVSIHHYYYVWNIEPYSCYQSSIKATFKVLLS